MIKPARPLLALLLSLSIAPPAAAGDAALGRAMQMIESGQLREAEQLMRDTLKDSPDDLELRFLLGKLYVDQNAAGPGEQELRKVLKAGMPRDVVLPVLGRALLLQERFEQLLNELDTDLNMSEPLRSRILTLRALAHDAIGDRVTARRNLDSALILDRDNRDAQLARARISLLDDRLADADRFLRPLLATFPDCAECWEVAGELAQRQGRADDAQTAFGRTLELDPDNFLAKLGRAAIALSTNDLDSAALIIDAARKQRPQDPMVAHLASNLALRNGDLDNARQYIDSALGAMPEHVPSLLIDGLIAQAAGDTQTARDRLRRVLSSLPNSIEARVALATLEVAAGNSGDAVTLLEPIVEAGKASPRVKRLFGAMLLRIGATARAEAVLRDTLDDSPDLRLNLAAARLASGEATAGLDGLRALSVTHPDPTSYYLAVALLNLGQIEQAAATGAELGARQPESASVQNLLGAIALAEGRPDDARAAFEQALQNHANFPAAQLNLSRAALLRGDLDVARSQLTALIETHAGHIGAHLQLARLAALANDRDETYRQLQAIQDTHPGELVSGEILVENLLRDREFERAQATAFNVLDAQPHSPRAIRLLARARIAGGYFPEAAELLAKQVEREDADYADWFYYAEALLGARRVNDAIDAYQRAAIIAPRSDLRAAMRMTGLQAGTAREADAKRELRRLALRNPLDASPNEMLGDILAKEGDRAAAHAAYAKAMRLQPSANLLIKLFRNRPAEESREDAFKTLREWLTDHPEDVNVRLLLAAELDRAGDAGARLEYDAILARQPDNVIALNNLAMRLLADEPKVALGYAEQAHQREPDNPVILDTYAQALIRNERGAEAIPLLEKAIDTLRTEPALRYHLAGAFEATGNYSEARGQIRRLLITYADFPDKPAAMEMLERLRAY
ncbi:MAG: PEP-CTERM system TPR-repeat protein PrsT [Chromatiales bacterium]|nr:PEP-CTERM system TPR-repeat protein PrsT [Gammaproteobacteria bacterium]MCP5352142.1 PEP-CTERM system TPR-repeat protein PrsT [Chromatiales bacterium]